MGQYAGKYQLYNNNRMKVFEFSVLLLFMLSNEIEAQKMVCKSGTQTKSFRLKNDGATLKFNTKGNKYQNNMDCTANYVLDGCAGGEVTCTKFVTASNSACTKGDKLTITDDNGSQDFCKKDKPVNYQPSGDFSLSFTSDGSSTKKGVKCTVTCTGPDSGKIIMSHLSSISHFIHVILINVWSKKNVKNGIAE